MRVIQTASAVYILAIFCVAIFVVVRAAITGDESVRGNLSGFPAALAAVAVLVCAVTTLVEVG